MNDKNESAEPPPDLIERADKLEAAADSAADHVRNLYIAFLAFAAYLARTDQDSPTNGGSSLT